MAQTKRKRRSKHRGTAAGTIESRGRTGRKPTSSERKGGSGGGKDNQTAAERRAERLNKPPSWRSAINRAALAAVILIALSILAFKQPIGTSIGFAAFALIVYIPMGYYLDRFLYQRRMRAQGRK
jgi:hypothetical protein